jgi:hypothetical protein
MINSEPYNETDMALIKLDGLACALDTLERELSGNQQEPDRKAVRSVITAILEGFSTLWTLRDAEWKAVCAANTEAAK